MTATKQAGGEASAPTTLRLASAWRVIYDQAAGSSRRDWRLPCCCDTCGHAVMVAITFIFGARGNVREHASTVNPPRCPTCGTFFTDRELRLAGDAVPCGVTTQQPSPLSISVLLPDPQRSTGVLHARIADAGH